MNATVRVRPDFVGQNRRTLAAGLKVAGRPTSEILAHRFHRIWREGAGDAHRRGVYPIIDVEENDVIAEMYRGLRRCVPTQTVELRIGGFCI